VADEAVLNNVQYINEAFRGRKHALNSVSWNKKFFVLNHFLKTRQPKISKIVSEKTTFEVQTNNLFSFVGCFVKLIFSRNSVPLRSVPSFGIDTSVDLGMPRNEYFFPRDKGNRF
jgi:hypothetical protein